MSHFNVDYSSSHLGVSPEDDGEYTASGLQGKGGDERRSPTGSDESGNPQSADALKGDQGDEDENAALTSQTLNADGTPKRPMNAFMIFARRRRPQVSAENQAMRTGEISKILSKEWNTMTIADKQFYLDQAKILKDNFNQKYPDYVYRRRPNNSRRRRRPDASLPRSADGTNSTDVDDLSGSAEPGDVSSTDLDDSVGGDMQYASMSPNPSSYDDHYMPGQPRSPYGYAHTDGYRSTIHDARLPYLNPVHDRSHDVSASSHLASTSSHISEPGAYSGHHSGYMSNHSTSSQSPAMYSANAGSNSGLWENRGVHNRDSTLSWLNSANERALASLSDSKSQSFPPSTSSEWSGSSLSSSVGSPSAQLPNLQLPTLSSAYYPTASPSQSGYAGTASSASPQSASAGHYSASGGHLGDHALGGRHGSPFDHQQSYPSPSINTPSTYTTTAIARDAGYQQPRPLGNGRTLPSVHSISSYSPYPPLHSPSLSSGLVSSADYWGRVKSDMQ